MNKIKRIIVGTMAYCFINIKTLLVEKVSFVWSIMLPVVVFWINKSDVKTFESLVYYWSYMVISSYVFGLGIYAVETRESGYLKTLFSINDSKISYIFGNIITQLIYVFVCLAIFNILVINEMKYEYLYMTKMSVLVMILCLPIGIGSYVFSIFRCLYISSVKTIATIFLFLLLIIANYKTYLNVYNLLVLVPRIISGDNTVLLNYIFLCAACIILGTIGICWLSPISKEKR